MLALIAHDRGHDMGAAVCIGLAAALKLYPALLGVLLLADRRWKESLVCLLTGAGVTLLCLCFFREGFTENLRTWVERTLAYTGEGNGDLAWLIDDKCSLWQLALIPMALRGDIEFIEEGMDMLGWLRVLLVAILVLAVLWSLWNRRGHDRVLMMSLLMVGFPLESGAYNLVLPVVPLVWWCAREKDSVAMPVLGGLLLGCESFVLLSRRPYVTLQAVIHPACIALMVLGLVLLRRRELAESLRAVFGGRRGRADGARPGKAAV